MFSGQGMLALLVEDVNNFMTVLIRDRKDPRNKIGNNQIVPLLPDAMAIVLPLIQRRTQGFIFDVRAESVSTAFAQGVPSAAAAHRRLAFSRPSAPCHCSVLPYGTGYTKGRAADRAQDLDHAPAVHGDKTRGRAR